MMNLGAYSWTLTGYSPTSWTMGRILEQAIPSLPEISQVPARVPGSVQQSRALSRALTACLKRFPAIGGMII